jgi:hypothetical protein
MVNSIFDIIGREYVALRLHTQAFFQSVYISSQLKGISGTLSHPFKIKLFTFKNRPVFLPKL